MSANWYGGTVDADVIRGLGEMQLEQRITEACARLSMATTQDEAFEKFEVLRVLIASRSLAMVERLERQRGLRK